jgi:voltage-gated potassium channel
MMRVVSLFLPLAVAGFLSRLQPVVSARPSAPRRRALAGALFWIVNPHAIEYRRVRDAPKFFSIFVYFGVFAFQIWVAERLLITVFNRGGLEDHGQPHQHRQTFRSLHHLRTQVGRTVVDQLTRLDVPFVLVETSERFCHELLKDKVLAIQGDAKRPDILQAAGIERARGVSIVIDNDSDNLYITVAAQALNPKDRIIIRAGQAATPRPCATRAPTRSSSPSTRAVS